jgi:hypothetical protein
VETRGIEVESVKSGPPGCIPVTDVGVTYDGSPLTLTLPGYQDRREVERHLKRMATKRTLYEYRCHGWRNAVVEPKQRDL